MARLTKGSQLSLTKEIAKEETWEQFKGFLDTLQGPLLVKDSGHRWIHCNRAFLEMFGMPSEEMLGRDDYDFFPPETVKTIRQKEEQVLADGKPIEIEVTIFDQLGKARSVSVREVRYTSSSGVHYLVCSMSDVTDFKRFRDAALQSEKQLRTFIEQMPVAVAMFDQNLKCLAASHAWLVLHHLELAPILGQDFYQVFAIMPQSWSQAHLRALCGQTVRHEDDRAVSSNGLSCWMNWEVRPWYSGGTVGGFVVMTESIEDKKRVMQELEMTRGRQVEASRLLAIGQMAAGVAHEINNPLTVIMGKAWLVQEKVEKGNVPTSTIVDGMKKISQYAERIGKIVKALRAFSRDASGDPMTESPLTEIFSDALSMCGERFRNHGIELRSGEIPADVKLKCRPTQVSQIIVNLLNNAFDAVKGTDGPWVAIDIAKTDSLLEIRVHDSGNGIRPEHEKRIFEPFFTTKEVGKGTGLGLSISTGIAKDHGGTLSLDLAVSRSCFLLSLPRVVEAKGVA